MKQIFFLLVMLTWTTLHGAYNRKNVTENIDCVNHKIDPKGMNYRGFENKTINGRVCQKWSSQTPHEHRFNKHHYPNKGLGDHNFCRNPDGIRHPWCYISQGISPRWEYCGIPHCEPYVAGWNTVVFHQNIDGLTIDVAPIQIRTDSFVGSGDKLWLRFVKKGTDEGPGFWIDFTDPPSYILGYCTDHVKFTMPDGPRVWTINRENDRIKLDCNSVIIFDINYMKNNWLTDGVEKCKSYWAKDLGAARFQGGAADYYNQYTEGWEEVTVGNQIIRGFDIDVAPIEIKTNSMVTVGSQDKIWIRFIENGTTDDGPSIKVFFRDPPAYHLGYCTGEVDFSMPPGPVRVWTFRKEDGRIKLDCNGEVIFDLNYVTNDHLTYGEKKCLKYWTNDFGAIRLQGSAEDYFRQHHPDDQVTYGGNSDNGGWREREEGLEAHNSNTQPYPRHHLIVIITLGVISAISLTLMIIFLWRLLKLKTKQTDVARKQNGNFAIDAPEDIEEGNTDEDDSNSENMSQDDTSGYSIYDNLELYRLDRNMEQENMSGGDEGAAEKMYVNDTAITENRNRRITRKRKSQAARIKSQAAERRADTDIPLILIDKPTKTDKDYMNVSTSEDSGDDSVSDTEESEGETFTDHQNEQQKGIVSDNSNKETTEQVERNDTEETQEELERGETAKSDKDPGQTEQIIDDSNTMEIRNNEDGPDEEEKEGIPGNYEEIIIEEVIHKRDKGAEEGHLKI